MSIDRGVGRLGLKCVRLLGDWWLKMVGQDDRVCGEMVEPVIAVTMGDPAGIGPEVIIKAHTRLFRRRSKANRVVVGDLALLESVAGAMGIAVKFRPIELGEVIHVPKMLLEDRQILPVVDLANVQLDALEFGRPDVFTGKAAIEYILAALELAKSGAASAIATGPVSKRAINEAGFRFTGHTSLIASVLGVRDYAMMFVSGRLRVLLVTTHIPISQLPEQITVGAVRRVIFLADRTLREFFGIGGPRLGVCGLNPHGGEGGIIGSEEERVIIPAILSAKRDGIIVEGPFASDTLFIPQNAKKFDAIIAMYHDQALIPVKLLGFARAVNVTVGLPVVRVSVSHGTANDIAGKWEADPTSMVEALLLANKMARLMHKPARKKGARARRN